MNIKSLVLTPGVLVSAAATWTAAAPASSGTPTVTPQAFDGSQQSWHAPGADWGRRLGSDAVKPISLLYSV